MEILKIGSCVEEKEDNTEEFIRGGNNSFFMAHTLITFPSVVSFESLGGEDGAKCHAPNYSTEMGVAPFRYSEFSGEFPRLNNYGVKPCVCNEFFVGVGKAADVWCFCEEDCCTYFPHPSYRGEDFHFSWSKKLHTFKESFCDVFYFMLEIEESSYLALEYDLPVFIVHAYGIVGNLNYLGSIEPNFSSSSFSDIFEDSFDFLFSQFSCDSCRWDLEEELKGAFCEDIVAVSQFFEEVKDQLFYLGLQFCNLFGYSFSFSCEEFNGIIGRGLGYFFGVFEEEFGYGGCVKFISFGFSEGCGFVEVIDEDGVNEDGFEVISEEEGEEVDVVVTTGFEADGDVFYGSYFCKGEGKFLEVFEGLFKSEVGDEVSFVIDDRGIEGIEGDIYADEDFKHDLTSLRGFKGGRMPSIPSSGLIGVLRPNQLIGDMEGGGQTPLRALSPGNMLSPCLLWPTGILGTNLLDILSKNCKPN